jgi:hypothetical protein
MSQGQLAGSFDHDFNSSAGGPHACRQPGRPLGCKNRLVARIIPPSASASAPHSERTVFAALRNLSDEWSVFHSVGWQSERHGRPGDGEADFVLLHPKGLLVLEVKGGRVAIVDGQWMSGPHIINDPYQQALASRKALQRYLLERIPGLQRIHTGHGAVFPDVRIADNALGPEAAPATTIDRDGLVDMPAAIGRLVAHWELNSSLSPQLLKLIKDQVAPTVSVRPLLREVAEDVTQQLLQLTQTQIAVLSAMRRQRRLIVYGGAGTGKTILAAERARQLADDGFQVLLVCFNRPLGRHLSGQFAKDDKVKAGSFAAVCRELAVAAHASIPDNPSQEWWDVTLPANAPGYAEETGFNISAVVVDEGQDFMPAWWESLELMMTRPEEDPFYVFVDTVQQLYRQDWRPPFEGNAADLDINCRNTLEIAKRVSALFGSSQPTLGTSGPEPQFVTAKSDAASLGKLEGLLELFLDQEKLNPSQIVILSPQRPTVDLLRGRTLAGYGLVAPGEDGVVVETIQRFKGLEADVVILLLPQLEGDGDRALAYVGMSRASVQLVVVGPASVRAGLEWDN